MKIQYKGRTIKIERVLAQLRFSQQAHWYAEIDGKDVSLSSFRSRNAALATAKEKIDSAHSYLKDPENPSCAICGFHAKNVIHHIDTQDRERNQ